MDIFQALGTLFGSLFLLWLVWLIPAKLWEAYHNGFICFVVVVIELWIMSCLGSAGKEAEDDEEAYINLTENDLTLGAPYVHYHEWEERLYNSETGKHTSQLHMETGMLYKLIRVDSSTSFTLKGENGRTYHARPAKKKEHCMMILEDGTTLSKKGYLFESEKARFQKI